jgi:tetratricopeptide (TPR) repeat protein
MSNVLAPIEVFCSYAHEDAWYLQKLETHLSDFKRQGLISIWYDRQIIPGTDWAQAIDAHLNSASIILLLVSPDFLASDYCSSVEMKHALERYPTNGVRVLPIMLRSVDWQESPLAHLQALPTDAKPIAMWDDQEEAFADIAAGIRRVIDDLYVNAPFAAVPTIWNIPFPRNPFFVGREDILNRLQTQLQAEQTAVFSQPQAISGLGGIGKTQIAIEYAYRFRQDYQAVFWTRADTTEAIISGFSTFAKLLQLPLKDEEDQQVAVQVVNGWLKTHTRWLLILDNADDLKIVRNFLPLVGGGHILLTTRAPSMGRLANRIEVEVMDQDVGTLFLLRRAGIIAADASLDHALTKDVVCAQELVWEMGGLPLALDQAGAYIEETLCSLSDYQKLYRTRRSCMLKERGGLVDDHPDSVITTWSLSFEQVEKANPAATELLWLCAFLHSDAIPIKIIIEGAAELGPVLGSVASDRLKLEEAIRTLLNYSLVHRYANGKMLSIHPLVQIVLKDAMDEKTQICWTERAMRAINHAFEHDKLFDDPDLSKVELHWNLLTIADEVERRLPPDLRFHLKLHKAKLHQLRFIENQPGANRRLALTEAKEALKLAEGLGEAAKSQACLVVAKALNMLQRFPEAMLWVKEACEAAQRAGDFKSQACGLRLRATLETYHNSEFGDVALLKQARHVLEQNQLDQKEAGLILSILWDEAVLALRYKKWDEFAEIMPKIEEMETNLYQKAAIMQYYGEAYTQQRKWKKALPYLEQAYELTSNLEFKPGECAAIGWWGIALCLGGKYDEGLPKVHEALEIEKKILNSSEGVAKWLVALGELVYIESEEMKQALEVLWIAEKLYEELSHIHLERTRQLINEVRNKIGEKEFTEFKEIFKLQESNFADYLSPADTISG